MVILKRETKIFNCHIYINLIYYMCVKWIEKKRLNQKLEEYIKSIRKKALVWDSEGRASGFGSVFLF